MQVPLLGAGSTPRLRRTLQWAAVALVLGTAALSPIQAPALTPRPEPGMIFRPDPAFRPAPARDRTLPRIYSAFTADASRLAAALAPAASGHAPELTFLVPDPRGRAVGFTIHRTQVMTPGLAAAHPEIRTYAGRAVADPSTTIALDLTPMGFHAAVRGQLGQSSWYVDPAESRTGTTTYLSYLGASVPPPLGQDFIEREAPEIPVPRSDTADRGLRRHVTQRTYRLALLSDPTFAGYFGVDNVLAAKVSLINRVDQIYNDDMAINLVLIEATDKLNLATPAQATEPNGPCGAHPCFDTDSDVGPGQLTQCGVATLGRTRTVLGQLVGASAYDVGHLVLGVNGGGLAYVGVVGRDYKAGGCTGLPRPQGDFFAIDFVTHELGHEFSALHTFDGVLGNCAGANRSRTTSVEPGSGSSVMAYAGICGKDDLQPHTDPYFSQRTIDQVSSYTGARRGRSVEVQTVSLTGFDQDGKAIDLSYPGQGAVTLTRGSTYTRDGIAAAVQQLTGQQVTVRPWDFDPYGGYGGGPIDDTGFQVIFAADANPDTRHSNLSDMAPLTISSTSPGVAGFVGETSQGGPDHLGGVAVRTSNRRPVVTAPEPRTIPVRTPFTLQGSARDPDGDRLSMLWEQNDVGRSVGTRLFSDNKVYGPLFRIFGRAARVPLRAALMLHSPGENHAGASGATRTFPDMRQILAGNTNARTGTCANAEKRLDCYSEYLPTRRYVGSPGGPAHAMHFRLTARDDHEGGGGTGHADVVLRLDSEAGPFFVTSPRKGTPLCQGCRVPVTWKVNGTQRLARTVTIVMSLDGGHSWRHRLVRSTPNDGFAWVRLPTKRSHVARLAVLARGNYFFAVDPGRLTVR